MPQLPPRGGTASGEMIVGNLTAASPGAEGSLYAAIRFDARLEKAALRRLAELDLDGCRAEFGRLIDGLRLDAPPARRRSRETVALLLDVLLQVNLRLSRRSGSDARYLERRRDLISEFAPIDSPEIARRNFLPALDDLLDGLRRSKDPESSRIVIGAQGFIEENYHRKMSLSTIAGHINVSSNYLSRQFRAEIGMTLTAFIHRTRLKHARILLAEGDRSISEIADLVGYQNYRDFYRNFVKYENASPRQAQRRLASGVD